MQPLAPDDPERIGPYRTIARLGSGAMGQVFLASTPDGRPVAVKLIAAALSADQEFRARFRREVATSKQVAGAYTAAVLDAGPDDEVPWLASEFLVGPNLKDAVDAAGPLPEATVLRLAAGLASALAAIHKAGLVHRDLKPANVILATDGPRVIDFGIARAADNFADSNLTRTGGVIGTPGFMSPEQAASEELTPSSDVFSLGSVLVFAATGRSPFAGASTLETMNNVVRSQPDLNGLSPRVRSIVERCLTRLPGARPTPAELLSLIGPVAPSTRPWPDSVSALAEQQRWQLSNMLGEAGVPSSNIDNPPSAPAAPLVPPSVFDGSAPQAAAAPPSSFDPQQAQQPWGQETPPPGGTMHTPQVSLPPATSPPMYPNMTAPQPTGMYPSAPQAAAQPGFSPQFSPGSVPPGQYPPQPHGTWVGGQPPLMPQPSKGNGAAVAVIAVIAVLAVAVIGGAVWILNSGGEPDDPTTAAIEDPATSEDVDDPTTPQEDETTEPAPDGQWNELYAAYELYMTTDDDTEVGVCKAQEIDWDDITTREDEIWIEPVDPGATPASYTDLVYDPCDIDTSSNTGLGNRYYTVNDVAGLFYEVGDAPSVDDCAVALVDDPAVDLTFDPWTPDNLAVGMTLCQATSNGNIVVAEVTDLNPETEENWASVTFSASVWTP